MKKPNLILLILVSGCSTDSYLQDDGVKVTVKKFLGIHYLERDEAKNGNNELFTPDQAYRSHVVEGQKRDQAGFIAIDTARDTLGSWNPGCFRSSNQVVAGPEIIISGTRARTAGNPG